MIGGRARRALVAGVLIWFVLVVGAALAPLFARALGVDPDAIDPERVYARASALHPLGTDDLGRDVLARLLFGGRVSLLVASASSLVSVVLGGAIGLVSGTVGGRVDAFLMRLTDALLAVPKLPLLMLLSAVSLEKLGLSESTARGAGAQVAKLVVVIVLFGWTGAARLARASALQIRGADFVLAVRALGASEAWILRRHILPHALPPLLVAGAVDVGEMIIYESALSFLGLGIHPPTPSWGAMLANGLTHLASQPLLVVAPGLMTFAAVAGASLAADGLREVLDPRRGTESLRREAELM